MFNNNQESPEYHAASALVTMDETSSNAPKRRKYNDDYSNADYRAETVNMQNDRVNNLLTKRVPQMLTAQQARFSPVYSLFSSSGSYRSTPSPEFAINAGQSSSPNYQQVVSEFPPTRVLGSLQYLRPSEQAQPDMPNEIASAEHNYAVAASPCSATTDGGSTYSATTYGQSTYSATTDGRSTYAASTDGRSTYAASTDGRSTPLSPERRRPNMGSASSDSGNSTMPDEVPPLYMSDWYQSTVKPEFLQRLQDELDMIVLRSETLKEQFMATRMASVPKDLVYNPNKSRLRKVYDNPAEAAERERNNLASRRSRFKKKIAQQIMNIQLEFDRNENFQLFSIHSWMGRIILELESMWLERGASYEDLRRLRLHCGFPPNSPNLRCVISPDVGARAYPADLDI